MHEEEELVMVVSRSGLLLLMIPAEAGSGKSEVVWKVLAHPRFAPLAAPGVAVVVVVCGRTMG